MFKKISCYALAALFLMSSVVLPLGDFSLMREIPEMYKNYAKVTSAEEMGVADFIGDYLLHGKEIFGHNEHDKAPDKGSEVQFQHQANPLNVIFLKSFATPFFTTDSPVNHPVSNQFFKMQNYRDKLFRPPLA